jgi:hypothetical protein
MEDAMAKQQKVQVAPLALVRRITRALAKDGEALRATREGSSAEQQLGRYYRIDISRNFLVETDVDIEALGRKLGVLKSWEEVADQDVR